VDSFRFSGRQVEFAIEMKVAGCSAMAEAHGRYLREVNSLIAPSDKVRAASQGLVALEPEPVWEFLVKDSLSDDFVH
jgi:hypothetical protein